MAILTTANTVSDGDQLNQGFFNGISGVRKAEAGETIAAGDAVFVYMSGHANEGEAWLSDADVQDKNRVSGIAVTGGNDGDTIYIMTKGVYVTSGLTSKKTYFLSTTAGDWTTTASGVQIGHAVSTTELFIDIKQDDGDAVGTMKHYHANITGLPANNLTAFWQLMDGTTISDAESPLNGQTVRDINANNEFLRAADTSGGTSGASTHDHTGNTGSYTAETSKGGDAAPQVTTTHAHTISSDSNIPPSLEAPVIIKIK